MVVAAASVCVGILLCSFWGVRHRLGGQGFLLTLGVSPHCVAVLSGCGHVVSVSFSVVVMIMWCHRLLVG